MDELPPIVSQVQVLAIVVLCSSRIDGIVFYQHWRTGKNLIGWPAFVYDDETAIKVGDIRNKRVTLLKTDTYNTSPNHDLELAIGAETTNRGLQFFTADGTIYPCDDIQQSMEGNRFVGVRAVLSYGFTVEIRAKYFYGDCDHDYLFFEEAKVVKCE